MQAVQAQQGPGKRRGGGRVAAGSIGLLQLPAPACWVPSATGVKTWRLGFQRNATDWPGVPRPTPRRSRHGTGAAEVKPPHALQAWRPQPLPRYRAGRMRKQLQGCCAQRGVGTLSRVQWQSPGGRTSARPCRGSIGSRPFKSKMNRNVENGCGAAAHALCCCNGGVARVEPQPTAEASEPPPAGSAPSARPRQGPSLPDGLALEGGARLGGVGGVQHVRPERLLQDRQGVARRGARGCFQVGCYRPAVVLCWPDAQGRRGALERSRACAADGLGGSEPMWLEGQVLKRCLPLTAPAGYPASSSSFLGLYLPQPAGQGEGRGELLVLTTDCHSQADSASCPAPPACRLGQMPVVHEPLLRACQ